MKIKEFKNKKEWKFMNPLKQDLNNNNKQKQIFYSLITIQQI